MILTVLLQGIVQLVLSCCFLIPLSLVFAVISIFSNGNAVANPQGILITGASGIGKGLALQYARPGVTIGITGRSLARLQDVRVECETRGATVKLYAVDVLDRPRMAEVVQSFDDEVGLDILIANAGISGGTSIAEGHEVLYSIVDTNIIGVLNTVLPILDRMKRRGKGQIVVIGSIASRIALVSPGSAAYTASKLAVESLAASWRTEAKPFGVGVTLVAPGFVATPMTDKNDFYMPCMYDSADASEIMVNGIAKDYSVVSFPSSLYILSWMVDVFPSNIVSPFLGVKWLNRKEGAERASLGSGREQSERTGLNSNRDERREL